MAPFITTMRSSSSRVSRAIARRSVRRGCQAARRRESSASARPQAAKRPGAKGAVAPKGALAAREQRKRSGRLLVAAAAALLAVVALVVATVSMLPHRVRKLPPSTFAADLPVSEVRQSGDKIALVLSDRSWLARPETDRRRSVASAFERAEQMGASALLVIDANGTVYAFAQGDTGAPRVLFPQ